MSGWGNNPFEAADEEEGGNPFTDQSVQEAVSPKGSASGGDGTKRKKKKKSKKATNSAPAKTSGNQYAFGSSDYDSIGDNGNQGSSSYSSDAANFAAAVDESDMQRRERELAEKESQLLKREAQADAIVEALTPTYPPFPDWCCIKPFFIHNIKKEIPDLFKGQQRFFFIYFHCWMALMWLNVISCSIQMKSVQLGKNSVELEKPLVSLVLSIVYAIFIVPIGFYLRYWNLYKAMKLRSSVRMITHLLFQLFNVGWSGMLGSGAWRCGGGGLTGAVLLQNNGFNGAAGFLFVFGALYIVDAVGSLVWFIYIFLFWKRGGLKFKDAGAETLSAAAQNEAVQGAAKAGARSAVKSYT